MRGKEASSAGFGNKKAAAFEAMPLQRNAG